MISTELELPFPPSVNGYWRSYCGRQIISERGRMYRRAIVDQCGSGRAQRFGAARIAVTIWLHAPDNRTRDLDNYNKGLLDGLKAAGVYNDDEQIDDLRVIRGSKAAKKELSCAVVRISEIGD